MIFATLALLFSVGLLLGSLLAGPLSGSQLISSLLFVHIAIVVLVVLFALARFRRTLWAEIRALEAHGYRECLILILLLIVSLLVFAYPFRGFDFSTDRRFQISARLESFLRSPELQRIEIKLLEGGGRFLSQSEVNFITRLENSRVPALHIERLSRLSPVVSLRQDLKPEHLALVSVETSERTVEVALSALSEGLLVEILSPMLDRERIVAVLGSEFDERLQSGHAQGLQSFARALEKRRFRIVPHGASTEEVDVNILFGDVSLDGALLVSAIDQSFKNQIPLLLLCEPGSCREKHLVESLGVETGDNILIDRTPLSGGGAQFGVTLRLDRFVTHEMFAGSAQPSSIFSHGYTTMRFSDHVEKEAEARWTPLLYASPAAWGETSPYRNGTTAQEEFTVALDAQDYVGDLVVAAAQQTPEHQVIVFGDSDWLTNQYFPRAQNEEVLLRMLRWLTNAEGVDDAREGVPVLSIGDFERFVLWAIVVPELMLLLFVLALISRSTRKGKL